MHPIDSFLTRRNLLRGGLALGASAFFVRGAYAEELARTPSMTEGPFYPPSCRSTPIMTPHHQRSHHAGRGRGDPPFRPRTRRSG